MPKKKYSIEFKLEIIAKILERNQGFKATAKEYGVCMGDIQKWVSAYEHHGIDGLNNSKYSYTGDFRIEVIEYKKKNGLSARKTATIFNIPNFKTVCDWERIYNEKGIEYLKKEMRGSPKGMPKKRKLVPPADAQTIANEELLKENERLRMENEYLKKLYALIQKENATTKPRS